MIKLLARFRQNWHACTKVHCSAFTNSNADVLRLFGKFLRIMMRIRVGDMVRARVGERVRFRVSVRYLMLALSQWWQEGGRGRVATRGDTLQGVAFQRPKFAILAFALQCASVS